MSEIWRDVLGYEGIYQVSTLGNVRNIDWRKTGVPRLKAQIIDKDGYHIVCLCKNKVQKNVRVHRLVAQAFLPTFSDRLQVNHKDENKSNNAVTNLECITPIKNANYGTRNERMRKAKTNTNCCSVHQFDLNGKLIKKWVSIREVQRVCGFDVSAIIRCCKGRQVSSYGYKWKYAT